MIGGEENKRHKSLHSTTRHTQKELSFTHVHYPQHILRDRDPLITTETDKNKQKQKIFRAPSKIPCRFCTVRRLYILLPSPGFNKHKISCLVFTSAVRLLSTPLRPGDPMASRAVNMCTLRSSVICLSHEISSHCPVPQGSFSHVGRGMLPLRTLHELHELHANTNT